MALVNALTTLPDVKTLLGITDSTQDARLELIVNACSRRIEQYCGRTFARASLTETYTPSGRQLLILRNYPIVSVSSVVDQGNTLVQGTDYIFSPEYANSGFLYRENGWNGPTVNRDFLTTDTVAGKRTIIVTYVAGYYLPADLGYVAGASTSLPFDLNYACARLACSDFVLARQGNFGGLTAMSEGGLSYSWGTPITNNASGISQEVAGMLNKYKRLAITA
jgi:hypothetical protein